MGPKPILVATNQFRGRGRHNTKAIIPTTNVRQEGDNMCIVEVTVRVVRSKMAVR